PISALAFTADPNRFAAASPVAPLTMFDINDAAPLAPEGPDRTADLLAAARSRPLLVASGLDRVIRVWRTDEHALWHRVRGATGVSALEIAPGGRLVASGSRAGSISVWSTASARLLRSFRAHTGRVTSIAFAPPDRSLLASAGSDGLVKLWDLRATRFARVL